MADQEGNLLFKRNRPDGAHDAVVVDLDAAVGRNVLPIRISRPDQANIMQFRAVDGALCPLDPFSEVELKCV